MTIGGVAEIRAFIQGPSEAVAGLLQGELIDVDPEGGVAVIGQSKKDVAAEASADHPAETKVPIPLSGAYTVPAGHQIGVRMHLTFVGTSAHTLFYDSTRYQSGVTFQTGQVITHQDCPPLLGKDPTPKPVDGGAKEPAATPPTTAPGPAEAVVPAVSELVPAVLDDLAALDEVGQEGLELVPEVRAVEGQLDRRPEEVDLLSDVVAPRLEGIAEHRLRL